jgi:hypothetical protein
MYFPPCSVEAALSILSVNLFGLKDFQKELMKKKVDCHQCRVISFLKCLAYNDLSSSFVDHDVTNSSYNKFHIVSLPCIFIKSFIKKCSKNMYIKRVLKTFYKTELHSTMFRWCPPPSSEKYTSTNQNTAIVLSVFPAHNDSLRVPINTELAQHKDVALPKLSS